MRCASSAETGLWAMRPWPRRSSARTLGHSPWVDVLDASRTTTSIADRDGAADDEVALAAVSDEELCAFNAGEVGSDSRADVRADVLCVQVAQGHGDLSGISKGDEPEPVVIRNRAHGVVCLDERRVQATKTIVV